MRSGNSGEKVRQLQEKLVTVGLLDASGVDGSYGTATQNAVKAFQSSIGRRQTGIADMQTQQALEDAADQAYKADPSNWTVVDDEE